MLMFVGLYNGRGQLQLGNLVGRHGWSGLFFRSRSLVVLTAALRAKVEGSRSVRLVVWHDKSLDKRALKRQEANQKGEGSKHVFEEHCCCYCCCCSRRN